MPCHHMSPSPVELDSKTVSMHCVRKKNALHKYLGDGHLAPLLLVLLPSPPTNTSPMFRAGHQSTVEILLAYDARPDLSDFHHGLNALHCAVVLAPASLILLMLESATLCGSADALLKCTTRAGLRNALHFAVGRGRATLLRDLLQDRRFSSTLQLLLQQQDTQHLNPLELALLLRESRCV